MEEIRPDEELEAKEFEEATKSRWKKPDWKISELDWALNKWVIGLVLILIVLFGGRWVHHALKNDDTKKAPVAVQTTKPTTKPVTTTPTATEPKPTQTPTEVPNTGPGSTAAVFLAAVIIAGSGHYVITSRKTR